jgi:O-antigen ligase
MVNDQVRNNEQKKTLREKIISEKFSKPIVIIFLILASLFISLIVARGGYVAGLIILCFIIASPIAYATVAYPQFGIIVLIVISFFINYISRLLPEDTPIGLVMDALTYLLIIGFFVQQKKEKIWSYFDNTITWFTLAWIGYNIFEIINPSSPSILEWVFTVRTVGFIMLMYFVFVRHIQTKEFIKRLLKIWLILAFIAALSGFQQEHFGLFSFENTWVHRNPDRYKLLFIGGHLRKWGIFSDPVVYAYNMVAAALLCIALMFGPIKTNKKIILGFMAAFFFTVMLYSGTRASYVIIPAGLSMLFILNFNKKILVFAVLCAIILGVLIRVPTSNPTLARFQSAFRPSKDASFEERARNQERIKPYILSHPIGGGLGSVGIWGQRFAPNSYLAQFPPDSGYVRVAVEMGWIGLLLYCIFNFVIMYKGLQYFYLIKDPELKTYCLGMLLIIFAFDVGNFPQQALVQYPSNILFYLAMALLIVTMRLDLEQRKSQPQIKG